MTIERHNIFELIGKHQNRYEHAIITTFTFDFPFFEERVMRALRTANVRNINVLADAKYLEHAIESAGETIRNHHLYSLIPVSVTGVFHPKIMLLVGPKDGLLIMGSGNFTSSGVSANDEIWSAFQLDHPDGPNAPVFSAVWKYIQQYAAQAQGYHVNKLSWITQKAAWLKALSGMPSTGFTGLSGGESIAFIANERGRSTLAQLRAMLPQGKVRRLTVISPYFDENGDGLRHLRDAFDIREFYCITDAEYGLLPYSMDAQLEKEIVFIDWAHCIKNFERKYNRLHAKIFHFDLEDGSEYLLLGSANATGRGLGSLTGDAVNAEAGLLLHRANGGNYLKDLGIQVDSSKAMDVWGKRPRFSSQGDTLQRPAYRNRILFAQCLGKQLTLLCKEPVEKSVQLGMHQSLLVPAVLYDLQGPDKEFVLTINEPYLPHVAALYQNGQRISPFVHVDDIGRLSKTNPDARQAAVNDVIEALKADPNAEGYAALLDYQEYNWLDEEEHTSGSKTLSFRLHSAASKTEQTFEAIDEKAFYQLSSVQLREAALLNDTSTQIADFLNLVSKGLVVPKGTFESAEQQLALDKESGLEGRSEEAVRYQEGSASGEKDARAFDRHFDKVQKWFGQSLKKFFDRGSLADSPERPLTLKELNNVVVALDLLILFNGKRYIKSYTRFGFSNETEYRGHIDELAKKYPFKRSEYFDKDVSNYGFYEIESELFNVFKQEIKKQNRDNFFYQEPDSTLKYYYDYVPSGMINGEWLNGIKWNLFKVLSPFLICANRKAGYKEYQYPPAVNRQYEIRLSVFQKSIFLLLNLYWNEKDVIYRDLMLLDLLHNIYPKALQNEDITALTEVLRDYYERSQKKYPHFEATLSRFTTGLIPQFLRWRSIFDSEDKSVIQKAVTDVSKGEWVYHSRIGFASVFRRGAGYLEMQKAGFPWEADRGAAILKIEYPFQSITIFSGP